MLRVLFLGLRSPGSTFNAFQPLRAILSPWDLLLHAPKSLHARLTSDFAARWPDPPKPANDVDGKTEPGPSACGTVTKTSWKGRLLQEKTSCGPIRPLRPSRPPPKHALPPESPVGSPGSRGGTTKGGPRIAIHPLHLIPKEKPSEEGWDSSLEELLPPEQPFAFPDKAYHAESPDPQSRDALLQIIAETRSVTEAWQAYNSLLAVHKPHRLVTHNDQDLSRRRNPSEGPVIPYAHLHRLARLLSSSRPRTRDLFLRLLSVLTTLRTTGGTIFVWEWNALIDCAGKGWRKTNLEDYRAAVDVFKDMVTSGRAVSSLASSPQDSSSEGGDVSDTDGRPVSRPVAQPDIVTFTTLLDIASHTFSESAIVHATSLLNASQIPWNQVTHMARLPYFIRTNQLEAVRDILRSTIQRGLDLYTLNGCLWAFARSGRLRVALQVYGLLRRNIHAEEHLALDEADAQPASPSPSDGENFMGSDHQQENPILNIPGFVIPAAMQPDRVTYTLLIQALCYHGDLIGGLTVFRDMVSTVDPASRRPPVSLPVAHPATTESYYKPTFIIYRAIFLGFARHAHKTPSLASNLISRRRCIDVVPLPEFAARLTPSSSGAAARSPSPQEIHEVEMPWTLENLERIFESFLEMDWNGGAVYGDDVGTGVSRPSERMIYWIMVAYAKTTKRDLGKMYKVWQQLDIRFGYGEDGVRLWRGRLARMSEALEKGHRQINVAQDDGQEIDSNG